MTPSNRDINARNGFKPEPNVDPSNGDLGIWCASSFIHLADRTEEKGFVLQVWRSFPHQSPPMSQPPVEGDVGRGTRRREWRGELRGECRMLFLGSTVNDQKPHTMDQWCSVRLLASVPMSSQVIDL